MSTPRRQCVTAVITTDSSTKYHVGHKLECHLYTKDDATSRNSSCATKPSAMPSWTASIAVSLPMMASASLTDKIIEPSTRFNQLVPAMETACQIQF
eukprot:4251391-Amphidinium_carterae.1